MCLEATKRVMKNKVNEKLEYDRVFNKTCDPKECKTNKTLADILFDTHKSFSPRPINND